MREGEVDAVLVVPAGYGRPSRSPAGRRRPAGQHRGVHRSVAPRPRRPVYQVVGAVSGWSTSAAARRSSSRRPETIQTEDLNFISYFVPSVLALSVMQVGIFAAIPLVADREKLILKRLAATPLRRWQLVGSNVVMRLLIALVQAVIIVAVGVLVFGVEITGNLLLAVGFVILGAVRSSPSATSSPRSRRPRRRPTGSPASSSSR